ncbi:hypothetical protein Ancab_034178 [Ancistrocladus abbreviatus]
MGVDASQCLTCPTVPVKVKIDSCDAKTMPSLQDSLIGSNCANKEAAQVKNEASDDEFDDSLDHIVLRERRRMLLSWILEKSLKPSLAGTGQLSNLSSEQALQQSAEIGIHDNYSIDGQSLKDGNSYPEANISDICQTLVPPNYEDAGKLLMISQYSQPKSDDCKGADSVESRNSSTSPECSPYGCLENLTNKPDTVVTPALSLLGRVKLEPLDINESQVQEKNGVENFSIHSILPVKSEPGFSEESTVDELDHLPLMDRMKLLSSGTSCALNISGNLKSPDSGSNCLESVIPISVCQPRKRKRTATNSVETALEEDAPALMKVLIAKGVSMKDIKLYGGIESDDPIDDSLCEDSFADLEAVLPQLFSHRQSFLKFPPIRCSKDSKASYCLSCLLSLIEQTQYLSIRSWPVEWGWCRDLQSFIFVFSRHNRIVLERPEYGYATYFFELLGSLPVDWQIKRLVTAMKLTSCGRITLIENRSLMVGEDLTEGEARVLEEYGWIPNTGLGTLLNYCDRVYHDRKNEKDASEWRSKIAKQLVNGFNGGMIVSTDVLKGLANYQGSQNSEVKLEL